MGASPHFPLAVALTLSYGVLVVRLAVRAGWLKLPRNAVGSLPEHIVEWLQLGAFLALACIGGVMYLLQERAIKTKRFGLFYSRLPSLEALDKLNHHCLSVGFPLLTLGLITGSIWAKQAWGAYWHWDPKETWSLVTWFLYAAAVHQRFTVGWRGRRVAILSIIAFLAVLFTLWGVSFLLKGVHTYVS